ncbi:MAG: hypothetical protein H6850_01350 [Alphaproteobacteria bacterium]|nr:MAG: hypothetical protein H6850_01350 [Alphaproteobacteria bacterium]
MVFIKANSCDDFSQVTVLTGLCVKLREEIEVFEHVSEDLKSCLDVLQKDGLKELEKASHFVERAAAWQNPEGAVADS